MRKGRCGVICREAEVRSQKSECSGLGDGRTQFWKTPNEPNLPKPVKTASFPRPAPPTAQREAVAAGATANRASVLDCGSPLPLWRPRHARKRQRAAALQNLTAK